jgi:TRAP-type C4-dicarboxylate transport system permease small subunit
LRIAVLGYLGAMLAYGGVNFAQDLWHEQIVKRGWTDAGIPSALLPGARPIWLVIVALAVLATLALLRETKSPSYSAA